MRTLLLFIAALLLASCNGNSLSVGIGDMRMMTVTGLSPLEGKTGDVITVQGSNLAGKLNAVLGDKTVSLEIVNANTAQFVLPEDLPNGIVTVTINRSSTELASLPLYNQDSENKLPASEIAVNKICDTTVIRNQQGEVVRGTRYCGVRKVCSDDGEVNCVAKDKGASVAKADLAAKIMSGESVAGVAGTAFHDADECQADGEGGCKIDGVHFKAAKMQNLNANDIRQGVTIAGLVGTLAGTTDICSVDGDIDCRALPQFPAVDRVGVLMPLLTSMRSTFSIAGNAGLLANCAHDGETGCMAVAPGYAAALTTGAASKILLGQNVATVDGSAAVRPVDCSSDAQTSCTAVTAFPAVKKADLITNAGLYQTSLSLAGLPGSLAVCNSDGQTLCLTRTSFPAVDKTSLQAKASQIKSNVSFAAVNGTLADCAADGGLGCVAVTNFPAAEKAGATAKIASSQTLAGILGTGATKPSDCASDGQTNCTAVSSYPAMLAAGAEAKILTGQTVGGVSGSASIRPGDCSSEGGTDCVTIATYPAFQASNLSAHLDKISNTATIAGATGTLTDCADGGFGCRASGPNFAAASTNGLEAKIVSGQTLAGTTGTGATKPADCSEDGEVGCTAIVAYPSAKASAIAKRTIDTATLGNIQGTAATPRPADCLAEAETNCVSVPAYPAMKVADAASKISSGQTVGGVNGTGAIRPANCVTGNVTECVAVASYPAVEKAKVQASLNKIGASLSIAGLSGTLADCSIDGATNCIATATNPAAQVVGAGAKILSGQSVAGVAGLAALTPSACSASGATTCVTSANYPSLNKSTLTSSANKMKAGLTLLSVTGTIADCSADGQASCVASSSFPAAETSGAAAKILNFQTLAGVTGSVALRPASCAVDGAIDCTAVPNYPAVDKSTISSDKIRRNTTIANVSGTLDDCSADGVAECVAVAAYPAALASGAAAKILTGNTLAGVAGSALVKPANCSAENITGCVAVPAYPAISSTALTAAAPSLRSGTTVLSTNGSLNDCASDGDTTCVTSTSYTAALASGAATKIIAPNVLAGITGAAQARPANCSSESQTGCVTVTNYPSLMVSSVTAGKIRSGTSIVGVNGSLADCSADAQTSCVSVTGYPSVVSSNITAGVVKSGVTIAGVAGQYPSNTYTLPGATASTADDVTDSNFNSRIRSSSSFEYFDSAGNRHTQTGDINLAAGNIKNTVSLFGITGSYTAPGNCGSDGATGCLTTSTWKAADTTNLTAYNIRLGTTIAGIAGANYFADSGANLSLFNRTTGTGANASTTVADFFDSVDDYNNGGSMLTAALPGEMVASSSAWKRDPSTDTNGNNVCDVGETCVYIDLFTNMKWRFGGATTRRWVQAQTACNTATDGFAGGRLPTQKELYQAYIDGIRSVIDVMGNTGDDPVWSGTATRAYSAGRTWLLHLRSGFSLSDTRGQNYHHFCVIEN